MKKLLPLFFIILAFTAYGQTKNDNPRTVYNKTKTRLIGIYDLVDCAGNDKKDFSGAISRVLQDYKNTDYIFEIGNQTFELHYENLSNADRSYLSGFLKKGNRMSVNACAGSSNGNWHVININLL